MAATAQKLAQSTADQRSGDAGGSAPGQPPLDEVCPHLRQCTEESEQNSNDCAEDQSEGQRHQVLRVLATECGNRRLQFGGGFLRDIGESRFAGGLDHDRGVHRFDDHGSRRGGVGANEDVAGQQ